MSLSGWSLALFLLYRLLTYSQAIITVDTPKSGELFSRLKVFFLFSNKIKEHEKCYQLKVFFCFEAHGIKWSMTTKCLCKIHKPNQVLNISWIFFSKGPWWRETFADSWKRGRFRQSHTIHMQGKDKNLHRRHLHRGITSGFPMRRMLFLQVNEADREQFPWIANPPACGLK